MAASEDLIDFNVIESHKENIQALPSGRSAKALAQIYSPQLMGAVPPSFANDANTKTRAAFEKELLDIEEADDPLDVYDRYVKWTIDAYPSAQATTQSQLLPLLERATKAFQTLSHYKNDPRYLKIWLHYIRLFSDAPREAFVFLARQSIGETLALYYEEFAAWLENAERWNQAEEVYQMGIEKEARPAERLLRKYGEFARRKEARPAGADEPSSPALPTVRPALAAKLDPFASSSPSTQPQHAKSSTTKKGKGSKLEIFADTDDSQTRISDDGAKGWDTLGPLADRRKENRIASRPMAGETLKSGKTNGNMEKMMVFRDTSKTRSALPKHVSNSAQRSAHAHQCVMNPKTGRLECVFVNLEAVYSQSNKSSVEYSFEELRARHRGWLSKRIPAKIVMERSSVTSEPMALVGRVEEPRNDKPSAHHAQSVNATRKEAASPSKPKQRGFQIFEDPISQQQHSGKKVGNQDSLVKQFSESLALNDENDENSPSSPKRINAAKKARKEERANRTRKIKVLEVQHIKNETKTIQLNLDSPTRPKIKRKKSADRPEPTMTINTKEAMDEIYGIFSQPLPSEAQVEEVDDDDNDDDSDDDCTSDDESTGTGKLSGPGSEYGEETKNELLGAQSMEGREGDGHHETTGWSDFTTSKHVPHDRLEESSGADSATGTTWEVSQEESTARTDLPEEADEDLITPQEENFQTRTIPVASEDFEAPAESRYIPNHRLPFMTPIAEQTESSLGATTARKEHDYFSVKTPSRNTAGVHPLSDETELLSSPFQEVTTELAEVKQKILQPIRTKSTKGTISLGFGTAKSQIDAKAEALTVAESGRNAPVINDQQCNPMNPQLREIILSHAEQSLSTYGGYNCDPTTDSGRSQEIRKWIKATAKASRSSTNLEKTGQALSAPPTLRFAQDGPTYTIKRELGAGTFAPVYLVDNDSADLATSDENNDGPDASARPQRQTHRKRLEAIKVEEPPSAWEYHIICGAHRRLGVSRPTESIVRAHEMHVFRDECFLVEEYRDQGTLLDLVNICRVENGNGAGMDELLAMWLTVELFRTVEALHGKQMIHGDLKGDNVLVRFDDPGTETDWSPTYFSSGAHGWSSKGICLIDFGRGIDMTQFVPSVAFIADWVTSEADCAEMRELRPWTYQIDYHGLAGTVHSMLFGKYMETIGDKGTGLPGQGATKTYRIRESFKRYWQVDIWTDVFHLLLNPLAHLEGEEGAKMPVLNGMKACRQRMEGWLEENCEKGVGLKGMVAKLEGIIRERKRKSKVGL